jgi:hypothetical protein
MTLASYRFKFFSEYRKFTTILKSKHFQRLPLWCLPKRHDREGCRYYHKTACWTMPTP